MHLLHIVLKTFQIEAWFTDLKYTLTTNILLQISSVRFKFPPKSTRRGFIQSKHCNLMAWISLKLFSVVKRKGWIRCLKKGCEYPWKREMVVEICAASIASVNSLSIASMNSPFYSHYTAVNLDLSIQEVFCKCLILKQNCKKTPHISHLNNMQHKKWFPDTH